MNILLDTHIFLWLLFDTEKIPTTYMSYLKDKQHTLYLSAISVAEIEIKKSLGNLDVTFDLFNVVQEMDIQLLDFNARSALILGQLPFHHKDPFDRMLIAQARIHGCHIMTVDSKFQQYDCPLIA